MSIINDALKKTEESIQRNSKQETTSIVKKSGIKSYLLYILIFALGIFLSSLIFKIIKDKIEPIHINQTDKITPKLDQKSQTPQTIPATIATPLPEEQNKVEKKFILNGIFFSDNDGYALVNNQIIRENDLVDGAKVEKITVNTVVLNNEGKIITLSTNR